MGALVGAALAACGLSFGLGAPTEGLARRTNQVLPGMVVARDVGDAILCVCVAEADVRVEVGVLLAGEPVTQITLDPVHPTALLDVANGSSTMVGSLGMVVAPAGEPSVLVADLVVSGPDPDQYRGDLARWTWDADTAWARQSTWLTPELVAEAVVLLNRNQSVQVLFVGAGQPLTSVTLQIGAQEVTVVSGFQVGSVVIEPGMQLSMQPATPNQRGVANVDGSFASSNLPHVIFAGAVLTWTVPPFEEIEP